MTNSTVERVWRRRLAFWPNRESRVAAAHMFDEGASLAQVLRRYPDGPVDRKDNGKPVRPARRAIYAHWALLQELQGQPDTDPDDAIAVRRIIAAEGPMRAAVRTGSALSKYRGLGWPNLAWYARQAPARWQHEYERATRGA